MGFVEVRRHLDPSSLGGSMIANATRRIGVGVLATAGMVTASLAATAAPATPHAEGDSNAPASAPAAVVDFTRADLEAMFPGRIGDPAIVDEGLPTLNQAMLDAEITTPYRQAAFLATIAHESIFEYNIREIGDTRPYGGRGYIQLTGDFNYGPAGDYFGIDLLGNPDLALSLEWSAPIARWYWTVARDINPMADALDMGAVNAAIGYPAGEEDNRRCDSFKSALQYLTGSVPAGVNCTRPAAYRGDTRDLSRAEWEALGDW
jgi:putative chitinase